MAIPDNPAASAIVQLQSQNADIQAQTDALAAVISRNQDTIAALEPVAAWADDQPDDDPS